MLLIIIIAVLDGKAAEPSGPQSTDTRSALKPQTVSISALGSAATAVTSAQKSVTSAQASVTSAPKSVTSSATDDNEKEEGEISSEEETGEIKDNPTTGVVMTRSRQQTRSSSRSALASSPAGNTRQTRQRAALNRRYVLKPSDPHIL